MRAFLSACAFVAGLCGGLAASPALAQSLDQLLDQALNKHDRVLKARADVDTARQKALAALGDWYPELKATASHGYQAIVTPHDANTRLPVSEVDMKLTQRLWDFGATNATIDAARLNLEEARLKLIKVESKLIREAAGIYVGVEGSNAFLKFSQLLVDTVREKIRFQRKKHAIENAPSPEPAPTTIQNVETPSEFTPKTEENDPFKLDQDGFDTDAEDSFTLDPNDSPDSVKIWDELTKAQKKQVKDELRVAEFVNGFRTFFGFTPDPDKLRPAPLLLGRMPTSIDDAVRQARDKNIEIALNKLAEAQARKDVEKTRSGEFLPSIDGILERTWKNNIDGTVDLKTDTVAKVELSWPFNLGMTAINTLKAAESDVSSSAHDLADTRLDIEEKVRDAWHKIETNRRIMEITQEQIAIREYLLQQAEEKISAHGTTENNNLSSTSLDIINFKKQIYEANRDYVKASYDVHIATYKLLELTGQLNENIFLPEDASFIAPNVPSEVTAPEQTKPARRSAATSPARETPPSLAAGSAATPAPQSSQPDRPAASAHAARTERMSVAPQSQKEQISEAARRPDEAFLNAVRNVFNDQLNAQKTQKNKLK